jgi:HNH endonuclease domain protein
LLPFLWNQFLGLIITVIGTFIFCIIYIKIRNLMKNLYFNSPDFLEQKNNITSTIKEFNDIAEYAKSIPNNNCFKAKKVIGEHIHLASFENTSRYNYRRDRNIRTYNNDKVYPASLYIVKRSSEEPIKYLCKYFDIEASEESLKQLEEISENISRIENTLGNLKNRLENIKNNVQVPKYIIKYYEQDLIQHLEVNVPDINIEYTRYVFEYVSNSGNSSQRTTITFNNETVEAVCQYLLEQIQYNKSIQAQRSLMTNRLRNYIKERDNYTCQICGASTKEQSLLLLEIDHIIPISKGGLSTRDNLQTLCWKCNRSKSNKIL